MRGAATSNPAHWKGLFVLPKHFKVAWASKPVPEHLLLLYLGAADAMPIRRLSMRTFI